MKAVPADFESEQRIDLQTDYIMLYIRTIKTMSYYIYKDCIIAYINIILISFTAQLDLRIA